MPLSPADEKMWATLIHVSGLVVSFLGALIGYLVLRERGAFIRHHTAEALNFQISWAIYFIALMVLSVVTLGIGSLLFIVAGPAWLILMIIAAVKTNNGEFYRYPAIIRFVS